MAAGGRWRPASLSREVDYSLRSPPAEVKALLPSVPVLAQLQVDFLQQIPVVLDFR
jgi:hypothetical protein